MNPSLLGTPAENTKLFRVVARSSNTNSFGLRQFVLVARDGEAWKVCRTDYCPGSVEWEAGISILIQLDENGRPVWSRYCVELPEKLVKPSAKALREIFGK